MSTSLRVAALLSVFTFVGACQTTTAKTQVTSRSEESSIKPVSSVEAQAFFEKNCLSSYPKFTEAEALLRDLNPAPEGFDGPALQATSVQIPGKHLNLTVDPEGLKRRTCSVRYATDENNETLVSIEKSTFGRELSVFGNDYKSTGIPVDFDTLVHNGTLGDLELLRLKVTYIDKS